MKPCHDDDKNEWDTRLERLESKLCFAEDQLDALNDTAYRQQRLIERLQARLLHLEGQCRILQQASEGVLLARDEVPPHY